MNKVAKDMAKVYLNTPTIDLLKNRSRKVVLLEKLRKVDGYLSRKEILRLEHMIDQIDAVLAARAAQEPLF